MNAQEIIQYIAQAEKKTPVKLYIKETAPIDYGPATVFGVDDKIVFGDWSELCPILEANREKIADIVIGKQLPQHGHPQCSTSRISLPALSRGPQSVSRLTIGKNAVIMMGAVINIGAIIGEGA